MNNVTKWWEVKEINKLFEISMKEKSNYRMLNLNLLNLMGFSEQPTSNTDLWVSKSIQFIIAMFNFPWSEYLSSSSITSWVQTLSHLQYLLVCLIGDVDILIFLRRSMDYSTSFQARKVIEKGTLNKYVPQL